MNTKPLPVTDTAEERLRAILDNSVDAVLVLDAEGIILFANHMAEVWWHRSAGELAGLPWGLPLVTGHPLTLDLPDGQGRVRTIDMHLTSLTWEGRPAYLAILHDITPRARELERLSRLNACFLSFNHDHDRNIIQLLTMLGEVLDADGVFYTRLDGPPLYAQGDWRIVYDYQATPPALGQICYDVIWRGGEQPTVLKNLPASLYRQTDPAVRRYNLQTYLGYPIRLGGITEVGAICVLYQRDFEPAEADLKFLQLVAHAISVEEERRKAQHQLQIVQAEQQRTAAAEREQRVLAQALRDLAGTLINTLNLDEVLHQLLTLIASVIPHEAANIMLLAADRQTVVLHSSQGRFATAVAHAPANHFKFRLEQVPGLIRMAETGEPLLIPNTQQDPSWFTCQETAWVRSFLGVPLKSQQHLIGFLSLASSSPNFFTPAHSQALLAFVQQANIALTNAQLYTDLRESEQLLQEAQQMARLGYWVLERDTEQLTWSPLLREILELDPVHPPPSLELWRSLLHPDDRPAVLQTYQAVWEGRQAAFELEYRLRFPDGRIKWLLERGRAESCEPGLPQRFLGVIQDISERKQAEAALRESEQRYRSLFANNHAVMLLIDPETGALIDANPAACRYYGYAREQLLQMRITDINILTPEKIFAEMQRAKREQRNHFLFQHRLANGEIRDVEVYSGPVPLYGRQLLYSIVHDVTERRQIERALQLSENKFRLIFELSPLGIFHFDAQGILTACNDQFVRIIGSSRAALVGLNLLELPDQAMLRCLRQVLSGQPSFYEGVYHSVTAVKATPIRAHFAPILQEEGTVIGGFGLVEDISQQYATEAALRTSEARYRALFENQPTAFALHEMIFDEKGMPCNYRFLEVNPAFEQLTGLQAAEIVGRTVLEVLPETEPFWLQTYGQVVLTGQAVHFEHYSQALGRYYSVTAFRPLPQQFATVFWDITDRRMAEQKLQQYAEHLAEMVEEKVRALEHERAKVIQAGKMAALGEMATGIAHELNQPLTSLLLDAEYLETMAQRALAEGSEVVLPPPALLDLAGNQIRDIGRCRRIIDHLRAFGRLSNETPTLVDVNQPLQDVFILIEQRLYQHNIQISRDLQPGLPLVWGHALKLEQVFLNLISNAEYALEEMARRVQNGDVVRPDYHKQLHIRSYTADRYVCVAIQDNGTGIAPEHQARLFEPFFTTKPVGQGTGLGLSISYGIVTEFGGQITWESVENEGTTFTVWLPVASEQPPPQGEAS